MVLVDLCCLTPLSTIFQLYRGGELTLISWSWSYGNWIYNYLYN
jgi:hypothetical protein